MVAFVIFWASLFAIFFFIAGTCFKALASAFSALLHSIGKILLSVIFLAFVILALAMLYEIVNAIVGSNLGSLIGRIIISAISLAFVIGLLGPIGAILLEIIVMAASYAIRAVSYVLEGAAFICERGYAKCLTVIIRRAEKC